MTDTATPIGNTYDKYGSTNPIERRLMDGFATALDAALDGPPPVSILEVGVGEGIVSERVRERFPEATVIGLDLPDANLVTSWRERSLTGLFGDGGALPFAADRFDLILAIEVLEHVDAPCDVLAEIARVGSGRLIASVPREPIWRAANLARGKYARDLGNTPGHINHWSKRSFVGLLESVMEIDLVLSPFPWTLVAGRLT